jgi:taurine dioxygenase
MSDVITSSQLEPFGVELELDLRHELSSAEQDALRRLYELHDIVLVRGEVLTLDEQMRVCELLGPVLMSDTGLMSKDTAIGLAGVALCFHSDYAYSPEPLQAISLHAVDVVDGETSTRFAGGRHAYESLATEVQTRVAELSALQVFGVRLDARNRLAELDPVLPSTVHPLAPLHPATGSRYLFAPEMTTDSIVGLHPAESEELLAHVFAALYGAGQVLEHRWCSGDFVLWNNTRVVHARADTSMVERRMLQRVTLGTKGYLDLYPELAFYEWDHSGAMVEGTSLADRGETGLNRG